MRLSKAVETYITHKQSLGIGFCGEALLLRAYVRVMRDPEIRRVHPSAVRKFIGGVGPVTMYWFSKYYTLNAFYRYALAHGYLTKSPLPLSMPQKPPRFEPYIYTNADVRKLLDAVNSGHRHVASIEPLTSRTLLLLLLGTGLRVSEALRLNLSDFDIENGILTVRETKFFKSRLVPVGTDLRRLLERYAVEQWSVERKTPESPLLRTDTYARISRGAAEYVFERLRAEAGVLRPASARYQPRLHDFRHTFAVTRLATWYREGKDVQRLLPHLTTYLGHCRIIETQRYLTMTTELLQEASQCFERYARPEVSHA